MTSKELTIEKDNSKTILDVGINLKESLEEKIVVQQYLGVIKRIEDEKAYQRFLNRLEVGNDETVFSPYDEYQDNVHSRRYYGLSRMLKIAFGVVHENRKQDDYLEISFEQFFNYIENAYEVLTDMNYVSGDRLYQNEYDLELYENPKNYSVVDFKQLLTLTDQELITSFDVYGIIISNNYFIAINDEGLYEEKYVNLTPREREAFYGNKAMKALGILSRKERIRKK